MSGPDEYEHVHTKLIEDTTQRVVARFDTESGSIVRFVAQLQKRTTYSNYKTVAQFDHDSNSPSSHDVHEEGLHLDVYRADGAVMKAYPSHPPLPASLGVVLRGCTDYLREHSDWLIRAHIGAISLSDPPDYR